MATLGLAACARRTQDLAAPTTAPIATTVPAAPTALAGAAAAAPTAQPTVASVSVAAPTPAAAQASPRRGGMLMTATQTDIRHQCARGRLPRSANAGLQSIGVLRPPVDAVVELGYEQATLGFPSSDGRYRRLPWGVAQQRLTTRSAAVATGTTAVQTVRPVWPSPRWQPYT